MNAGDSTHSPRKPVPHAGKRGFARCPVSRPRDSWRKCRSAAPRWQGATSENIGHRTQSPFTKTYLWMLLGDLCELCASRFVSRFRRSGPWYPQTMWPAIMVMLALWTGTGTQEILTAIQVHGNTLASDDEIRRLAGIDVGAAVDENTIASVELRLRQTKRFKRVEVLKRFASIADPSQILMVIIVDEGPVSIERGSDPDDPTRVVRRRRLNMMYM